MFLNVLQSCKDGQEFRWLKRIVRKRNSSYHVRETARPLWLEKGSKFKEEENEEKEEKDATVIECIKMINEKLISATLEKDVEMINMMIYSMTNVLMSSKV